MERLVRLKDNLGLGVTLLATGFPDGAVTLAPTLP